MILRPGKYNAKKLSKILKAPVIDKLTNSGVVESPGTKYTHYCPLCEMILIKNDIVKNMHELYNRFKDNDKKPIILCSRENVHLFKNMNVKCLGKNSEDACKNLFKTLRDVEKDYDVILAEFIQKGNMQEALFNRMIKSASGKMI